MHCNNKYIARIPSVQADGKFIKPIDNVGDSLKNYSAEEAAYRILSYKCKTQKNVPENASLGYPQFLPTESVKDLLSPELRKSRFVAFKEKFSEDMYFKKPELGKALSLPSKPSAFTNENFTYGLKGYTSERIYELIFPNKTSCEIKQDALKCHDKYLISHKRYFPSERIHRNYNKNFNPDAVYGMSKNSDATGQGVKKCLQHCDRMVFINKTQKQVQDRTTGQLGKRICRYNLNLEPNQTFGTNSKNQHNLNVQALIENEEPCSEKVEIIEALSHVNNLRRHLYSRSDFHINDLKVLLKKYDENETGYIKFPLIMKALLSLQIRVNERKIRTAIIQFKLLKNGNETDELVSIEEFCKMLHIQYPLPRKVDTRGFNKKCTNKQTTYRLLCSDREKYIVPQQIVGKLNCDDYTTAGDLITPDVSTHYGLYPSYFEVLRPREEMELIFKGLSPHNFDDVWQFAWAEKHEGTSGKMSVNEFKNILDEYYRKVK